MQTLTVMAALAVFFSVPIAESSGIRQLSLDRLSRSAKAIVLATVMSVSPAIRDSRTNPIPWDKVTIRVSAAIKGSFDRGTIELLLQSRGVKDFDPELKPGDVGVFFLKRIRRGASKLAYWGSVAVFERPNFK